MRAIVHDKGNFPDYLALREVAKPTPDPGEVLVRIHAASVNAADYRSMKMGLIPKRGIFGADIAGTVEACGSETRKFTVGAPVFGDISDCGFGGFAEFVAVPERVLVPIPAGVSFTDAAAIPIAAVTALQALRKGELRPGKRVLIHGAGGGVGTFAVQLAKQAGAEVTALCGSGNVVLMRALGADRVIDYTQEDFAKSLLRYDLILAVNGNRKLSAYRRALAAHGIFVMIGGALPQVLRSLLFGWMFSLGGKKMRSLAAASNPGDTEYVMARVAAGSVKPVIDRKYPLEHTAEAMRYAASGHAKGKIIIEIGPAAG